MNPSTLFIILGGGAILYWLSTKETPKPATSATTSPQPSQPAQPGTTPTTPSPQPGNVAVTPTVPTSQPAQPAFMDSLRQALEADLVSDPAVTSSEGTLNATFSVFNWHLAKISNLTDLPDFYHATGGQTDPNVPIRFTDYWAVMVPWLRANRGLSGIGAWRPAYRPAYASPYLGPGGWRA